MSKRIKFKKWKDNKRSSHYERNFNEWLGNTTIEISINMPSFVCSDGKRHEFENVRCQGNCYDKVCKKCGLVIARFTARTCSGAMNKKGCQWHP